MKKEIELYVSTVFGRKNKLKEFFFSLCLYICSWPRMLLEVFIRRDFGIRYFSLSGAILLSVILAIVPLLMINPLARVLGVSTEMVFWGRFLTWYLYVAAFLYMAIQRHNEIKRRDGILDLAHFSLSPGRIHPDFFTVEFLGKRVNPWTIETVLEPGIFFVMAFVIWMCGQPIGLLIVLCSIIYSFSYQAQHYFGTNSILDMNDKRLFRQDIGKAFIEGGDGSSTRGVNYYGRRPADPETRRQFADMFMDQKETVEVF